MENQRHQKTLSRKLRDLEDHLHFLNESLIKLMAGDEAYIKPLAAELRVLVCKSSGTEGLLWRIVEELNVPDTVNVHFAGNLDYEHPLAKGLQFIYAPIVSAGYGDPRVIPGHHSLKSIIKNSEALVVSGAGYTHENIIRAVAQQMGSAHEDDGAADYLVELSGIAISNQPLLIHLLSSDAEFVLEIGKKVLLDGESKGFIDGQKRQLVLPVERASFTYRLQNADFKNVPSMLSREKGTTVFTVSHPHGDWKTNSNEYIFGPIIEGGLEINIYKHEDKILEIIVKGICDRAITTKQSIPITDQHFVTVGFTWDGKKVVFYVCGQLFDIINYEAKL